MSSNHQQNVGTYPQCYIQSYVWLHSKKISFFTRGHIKRYVVTSHMLLAAILNSGFNYSAREADIKNVRFLFESNIPKDQCKVS